MLAKPAVMIVISVIIVCLSTYHIFMLAILESSTFLLLDYYFWFWTMTSWISVYWMIKNYLWKISNIR